MTDETYTTADGKTLHRWTDASGQMWCCVEYDHGPFCRRCVRVDETLDAILSLVVDGLAIVAPMPASEEPNDLRFRLTDEGIRQGAHLIKRLGGAS